MDWTLGGSSLLCLSSKYKLELKTLHDQAIAPSHITYDCYWFNNIREMLLFIFFKWQASEICQ